MRKIAVVTGTRAEYGYLKPLMEKIKSEEELKLMPLITGMHLLKEFGNSFKLVEKDFPNAKTIEMDLRGDGLKDMANYLSLGIKNFANFFNSNRPDIVVVLGDRTEALAASLASVYLNIPLAHINGGDISGGTLDESIRHSITKMAHLHFVHTKSNAKRVEKMGEEKDRIYVTGATTLDTILNNDLKTKAEIFKKCHLCPNELTFLVIQHPITTLKDNGFSQMNELFLALDKLKKQTILIYPNCDAGHKEMINLIKENQHKKYVHAFKNLSHEDYLSLLNSVDLMIGNSSSGIIESASFKLPVINIGDRQKGRRRSENIIDVKPEKNKILNAIDFALNDKDFLRKIKKCENKFGDGDSSQKIINILKNIEINDKLIQKQITY